MDLHRCRKRPLRRRGPVRGSRQHVPAEPLPSLDTQEGFEAHRAWEHELHDAGLGGGLLAGAVRRQVRLARRVAALRGGVLPGRRPAPGRPEWHLPAGAPPSSSSAPRSSRSGPAADGVRRRHLVAGVVGAGRRQRPGGDPQHRDEGRRRLGAVNGQKTWSTRAVFADWAFGLFRSDPEAPRHAGLSTSSSRFDAEGRDRPPDPPAGRRDRVRRDLPATTCSCPTRMSSASPATAGGRHVDDRLRARADPAQPRPVPRRC